MTLGPPSSSQGPPQRGDRCAPFVADEAEDYTWRISEFAVLEWIDVDAVVKVLTRECATWTDQEFRCVTDRSPGAQDKRTCLSSEPLGRLRASLQPILDTPTPADVRGESKGRVRCEYPALVKRELQSCSNVPMKMRQKVLKQWYRASTVATPHQVCLDAETVLRRRLAQAGCPVESARK